MINVAFLEKTAKKEIFQYFTSKYGIDKATILLNHFFEEKWDDIPGSDIFHVLSLLNVKPFLKREKELEEKIEGILKDLNHITKDVKELQKKLKGETKYV